MVFSDKLYKYDFCMEKNTMIVFLDVDKQMIDLYHKDGITNIPFTQANNLMRYMGEKKVMYVTNATETNAEEIINLIGSMGFDTGISMAMMNSNNEYIHANADGTIYINDELKFEGKFDCKLVDEKMKNTIKRTPIVARLLADNKLTILNEFQKDVLMEEFKGFKQEQIQKQVAADARLDSIILKDKVADWDGNILDTRADDPVEINLESEGLSQDERMMQQILNNAKKE